MEKVEWASVESRAEAEMRRVVLSNRVDKTEGQRLSLGVLIYMYGQATWRYCIVLESGW